MEPSGFPDVWRTRRNAMRVPCGDQASPAIAAPWTLTILRAEWRAVALRTQSCREVAAAIRRESGDQPTDHTNDLNRAIVRAREPSGELTLTAAGVE
jgi:hypothetical protein